MKLHCPLSILLLTMFAATTCTPGDQFSARKPFLHHIANFINSIANGTVTSNNSTHVVVKKPPQISASKPIVKSAVVVRPDENPALAVQRMSDTQNAVSLVSTIAPPRVRPCFVRPAFCPATSDACAMSRCARMYANGVRIGSRYYRKVKCRLNYCRETCGKAEWFVDGRRLIGCSDSVSTLDNPVWAIERPYPGSNRLDSRVLPIERAAQRPPSNNIGQRSIQRRGISHDFFNGVKSSYQEAQEHAKQVGDKIKETFVNLNPNSLQRSEDAIAASNVKNLTDFVDEQLAIASTALEHENDETSNNKESKKSAAVHLTWSAVLFMALVANF